MSLTMTTLGVGADTVASEQQFRWAGCPRGSSF